MYALHCIIICPHCNRIPLWWIKKIVCLNQGLNPRLLASYPWTFTTSSKPSSLLAAEQNTPCHMRVSTPIFSLYRFYLKYHLNLQYRSLVIVSQVFRLIPSQENSNMKCRDISVVRLNVEIFSRHFPDFLYKDTHVV